MKLYTVSLIHKTFDWDATLTFRAPDARAARRWAVLKMHGGSASWLVVRARANK